MISIVVSRSLRWIAAGCQSPAGSACSGRLAPVIATPFSASAARRAAPKYSIGSRTVTQASAGPEPRGIEPLTISVLLPASRPTNSLLSFGPAPVRAEFRIVNKSSAGTVRTRAGWPTAPPGETETRTQLSLNDSESTGASYQLVS